MKRIFAAILALALILSAPALAMTELDVIRLVCRADASYSENEQMPVFLLENGEGAWAFSIDEWVDISHRNGKFWYVTPNGAQLVCEGKMVYFCGLLDAGNTQVFYFSTGEKGERAVTAFAVLDGVPVKLSGAEKFMDLFSTGNALGGMLYNEDKDVSFDYCFLAVEEGVLKEVTADELKIDLFLTVPGAKETLEAIEQAYPGWELHHVLFRTTEVATLNYEKDGEWMHAYFYNTGEGNDAMRGWEDEVVLFEGKGSASFDLGLPVIETVVGL